MHQMIVAQLRARSGTSLHFLVLSLWLVLGNAGMSSNHCATVIDASGLSASTTVQPTGTVMLVCAKTTMDKLLVRTADNNPACIFNVV